MRLLALWTLALAFGCKAYDPLYCDSERPCLDSVRSFCDLEGQFPESDGIKRTCISPPDGTTDARHDQTPPIVVAVSPGDGEGSVEPVTKISISFSEPIAEMDPAPDTIVISKGNTSIRFDIALTDSTAILTPRPPLDPGSLHTVTIGTGVRDLAGNALEGTFSTEFSTREARWSSPSPIESINGENATTIGVTARNGHLAVTSTMQRCDPSCENRLIGLVFRNGKWSTTFTTGHSTAYKIPAITLDNEGRAVIAWPDYFESEMVMYATRYDGAGWSNSRVISNTTVAQSQPTTTTDEQGNAFVLWGGGNLWLARFDIATGWQDPITLETSAPSADNVSISSSAGRTTAIWKQNDSLFASRYEGSGWTGPELVSTILPGYTALTGDDEANVMAIWGHFDPDGDSDGLYTSRFMSSWNTPTPVMTGNTPGEPAVLGYGDGKVIAAWRIGSDIWTSAFSPDSGWGAPTRLQAKLPASFPHLAGGLRRSMILWRQERAADVFDLYGSEGDSSARWTLPTLVERADESVSTGRLVYDETSNIFVAFWIQTANGSRSIFWSRYE